MVLPVVMVHAVKFLLEFTCEEFVQYYGHRLFQRMVGAGSPSTLTEGTQTDPPLHGAGEEFDFTCTTDEDGFEVIDAQIEKVETVDE